MNKNWKVLIATALLGCLLPTVAVAQLDQGDAEIRAWMESVNEDLIAAGANILVEQVELFVFGQSRPVTRLHQLQFRWVPGDPRRLAAGDDITFIVDQSGASTSSGLGPADIEVAIDRAIGTWQADGCISGDLNLVKRPDPGNDITIVDFLAGAGGFGNPFAADIVVAGWFPAGPPFFAPGVLALSVTFTFSEGGVATDIDGDNRFDQALNEIYLSDGFDWGIDVELPGTDVETVILHEMGHSLGIGHFGPRPRAVMNPVYQGLLQETRPIDHAGACTVYGSWPH